MNSVKQKRMTYLSAILSTCLFLTQPLFVLAQEESGVEPPSTPIVLEAMPPILPTEGTLESNTTDLGLGTDVTRDVSADSSGTTVDPQTDDSVAEEDVSVDTDMPTVEELAAVSQSTPASELLQQTFNIQEVVDPTEMEVESVTDIVLAPEETPSGNLFDQTTEEVTEEVPDTTPSTEVLATDPPAVESFPETTPEPAQQESYLEGTLVIALEEVAPTPEYVFSVHTGKQIPTKKRIRHESHDRSNNLVITETEQTVSVPPTITADNSEGVMDISGVCASTYYVVLIYKQEADYDRDRSSYVINKAYPCEGGTFSYKVRDLPLTLKNGTYYVLIGEQGDTGPWSPITALTQVEIQHN